MKEQASYPGAPLRFTDPDRPHEEITEAVRARLLRWRREAEQENEYPLGPFSVPVTIDEFRTFGEVVDPESGAVEDFWLARCVFFLISSSVPTPLWNILIPGDQRWLLGDIEALGLSGVVMGPRRSGTSAHQPTDGVFSSADDLISIFSIELEYPVLVETADIWLPPLTVKGPGRPGMRGDVFRVSLPLFQAAFLHRIQEMSTTELLAPDWERHSAFSEIETEAFAAWARSEVEQAKEQYPKTESLSLTWNDERRLSE